MRKCKDSHLFEHSTGKSLNKELNAALAFELKTFECVSPFQLHVNEHFFVTGKNTKYHVWYAI